MKNSAEKLAVIYANENNIWCTKKNKFVFVKCNNDEYSYVMPLGKAEQLLAEINEERKAEGHDEAYLNEIPNEEENT